MALAAVAVSVSAAARLAPADSLLAPGAAGLALLYAVLGAQVLLLAVRSLLRPQPEDQSS